MFGYGAASAGLAYLIKPIFDDVLIQHVNLGLVGTLIVLLYTLKGLFSYFATYLMSWVGQRAVMDLRNRLYQHVIQQSVGFFKKKSTGTLISAPHERRRKDSARGLGGPGRPSDAELRPRRLRRAPLLLRFLARGGLPGDGASRRLSSLDPRPQAAPDHGYRARALARHLEHPARDHLREPHRQGVPHGGLRDRALRDRDESSLPQQHAHHPRGLDHASNHGAGWRTRDRGRHLVRKPEHRAGAHDHGRVHFVHGGALPHVYAGEEALARERDVPAGALCGEPHLRSSRHRAGDSRGAGCRRDPSAFEADRVSRRELRVSRRRGAGPRASGSLDRSGAGGGARRDERGGEVYAREPGAPFLRPDGGGGALRRSRHPEGDALVAEGPDRSRDAGGHPVRRYRAEQHCLWLEIDRRRGDPQGGGGGERARFHRGPSAGLRYRRWGKGIAALRRPETEARHRPRHPEEPADSGARRGDELSRCRIRKRWSSRPSRTSW